MFNFLHNHYQAFLNGFSRFINNIGASFMMTIVIGITLCLPSAGLLLIENAGQISQNIEHEAEISIFLDKTVSKDQIDFIELSLKKNSLVKKIHFEPKLIAWEKLQTKLDVAVSSSVSANPLPDAFFISLNTLDEIKIQKLIDNLDGVDGIESVTVDGNWIKKLRIGLSLGKLSVFFIAALLIIVLLVVIGNTIRLQTLTYKDEIEVSKLIGATNAFIQRPFIYTGILYGLGGGIITISILKLSVFSLNVALIKLVSIFGTDIIFNDLPKRYYIYIIVLAMLIGLISSYISARNSIQRLKIYK
ncbi:permease-like cell division protein FtsX [Methylophilaceae bacterium]|nr:permease-like cell division protein FtsX [Methylophilaceae bacterium]|tara:strand:+ start:925 stop:1833 length:909 start_codon:yes stop_codon:yes gene_type:complete